MMKVNMTKILWYGIENINRLRVFQLLSANKSLSSGNSYPLHRKAGASFNGGLDLQKSRFGANFDFLVLIIVYLGLLRLFKNEL